MIGVICIIAALFCEIWAYYKQAAKTLRTKKSAHVSTSFLMIRLAKYAFTLVALAIYANWIAFGMQIVALVSCVAVLIVVIKYKPKNWRLF